MPYRRVIKVSDEVYEKLWELTKRYNLESPNQLLKQLLAFEVTPLDEEAVRDVIADEILTYVGRGNPIKPLTYSGGDWVIKDEIISLLVESKCRTLVEVFGGSGVISMYAPRDKFKTVIYNDKDSLLTNFFIILKEKPAELMRRLLLLPFSRELFNRYTELIETGEIHKLDPVEKAVVLFYVNRVSVNSRGSSFKIETTYPRATILKKQAALLSEYAKMWADVAIENLDFRDIIRIYDREYTVFYCDPPFLSIKGLNREYYRLSFTEADMRDLLNILSKVKGKFVLKLPNDHLTIPFIKTWVEKSKYNMKVTEHKAYQVKVVGEERPKLKTVLVYNFKPKANLLQHMYNENM